MGMNNGTDWMGFGSAARYGLAVRVRYITTRNATAGCYPLVQWLLKQDCNKCVVLSTRSRPVGQEVTDEPSEVIGVVCLVKIHGSQFFY